MKTASFEEHWLSLQECYVDIYKGSSILHGMLYPSNKRARWEQRTLSIRIASTIGKQCYAFEGTQNFLEKEYCIILKETLHICRGGNTANFARVLSTASLKGHVAFKSWYVFLSFRYCILEMKKCLFEKELSFFKKCCIFWMEIASFKKHCTCVQGCLEGISHRSFQVGHIVKGDTASFVKGYCAFCHRRVSFLKELCGLYVCVCMPNFVKGDLHTLHLKCLFEKKICF